MDNEVASALQRTFGYVPDEEAGEKWVIYRDHVMVVIHHREKPKIFPEGCRGNFHEIEPDLEGLCF